MDDGVEFEPACANVIISGAVTLARAGDACDAAALKVTDVSSALVAPAAGGGVGVFAATSCSDARDTLRDRSAYGSIVEA